jgi:hypothetical protein
VRIPLLVLLCCTALPAAAIDCSAPTPASSSATGPIAPLPGLEGSAAGADHGGIAELSVEAVLTRLRDEKCTSVATADGYQKQTEFDNSPYRYNMKPGQSLSAADFDAWMKSRGIRIVGAADVAPAAVETAAVEIAVADAAPATAELAMPSDTPAATGATAPVVAK